jgi:hypothetical protein
MARRGGRSGAFVLDLDIKGENGPRTLAELERLRAG